MSIDIEKVSKKFLTITALEEITFHIETGELVALLGPSGSGKTTLLRIIAGLEFQDSGSIKFSGEDAQFRSAKDRKVGFVFQHYALFKHMTVFENIAFGLRVQPKTIRPGEQEIRDKVQTLLNLVQLQAMGDRFPSQLSGGQRQRVALARALAIQPKVLLLDEPFGALDAKVRQELRQWLRRLPDDLHMTSLFVTHDVEEALEVADRVVIMQSGKIEQIGTPEAVYHEPRNAFVYQFIGKVNLFHARNEETHTFLQALSPQNAQNQQGVYFVRPHLLRVDSIKPADKAALSAKITQIVTLGALVRLDLESQKGEHLQAELSYDEFKAATFAKGDTVFVSLKEKKLFFQDYAI